MQFNQHISLIKNYLVIKSWLKNMVYKADISNKDIVETLNKQGKAKNKRNPTDYNQEQLSMGIKIEMEHTNDKELARKIAQDHLSEIPDYYTRLKEMEDEAKADKKQKTIPSIEKVKKFLKNSPNPDDDKVHAWSEKNGYDNHAVEALFYRLATQAVNQKGKE